MKILLISRGYPSKRRPQWGIFERDQALALQTMGHEVIIISVELRYYWRSFGLYHIKENGLEIYSIGFPNFFTQMTQKWAFAIRRKLAFFLYEKIEKKYGKPDIIYAQYFYNITIGAEIKKRFDIPLIGIEHWSKLTQEKLPSHILNAGNIAYGLADRIISVSKSLHKQILYHFNKDSFIVNNMIGDEFCKQEIFNKATKVVSPIEFVSIGTLNWKKGFDILIDAFHKSGLKEKGGILKIVGAGKEHDELQRQIIAKDLSNNIILVGRKSREEIIEILKSSDVFVLSSKAETFSVVCIEGLCLGLPVIATICGGPEEFINEKNGILVPPNDPEALSQAMLTMFYTFSNYDTEMIAKECRRKFSSTAIAQKLTNIFEDVINSNSLY